MCPEKCEIENFSKLSPIMALTFNRNEVYCQNKNKGCKMQDFIINVS